MSISSKADFSKYIYSPSSYNRKSLQLDGDLLGKSFRETSSVVGDQHDENEQLLTSALNASTNGKGRRKRPTAARGTQVRREAPLPIDENSMNSANNARRKTKPSSSVVTSACLMRLMTVRQLNLVNLNHRN